MTFSAALAADLGILTAALDEPGIDVVDGVRRLADSAAAAVPTYLGLSITVVGTLAPFAFTALADGVAPDDVRTSLALTLPGAEPWAATLVLYAGTPGAFVDLAADLAWLTAWPSSAFVLDQHLLGGREIPSSAALLDASVINQAIGMLIGQGHVPEHAEQQIASTAARLGISRHAAALGILAERRPQ